MLMITLYAEQKKKRHRCIEQSFRLCGRRRGWDVSSDIFFYCPTIWLPTESSWWGEATGSTRGQRRDVDSGGQNLLSFFLQLLSTSLSTPWVNFSTLNLKHLVPSVSAHSLWDSCFILLQHPFLNSKHLSSSVLCKENPQQWTFKWKRKHRASACSQVLVSVPGCLLLTRMAMVGAPEISLFWAVFRNHPNMIALSDQRK